VILLLVGGVLLVLFWAGTLWFQAYIYTEPAEDLHWRAPAAAAAVTAFLALWCFLAYRYPDYYDPLFSNPDQVESYSYFWSVEKGKEKVRYERRKTADGPRTQIEYFRAGSRRPDDRWKRERDGVLVEAIIVEEGPAKKEVRYNLQRPSGRGFTAEETARYVEERGGRVMTSDDIGRVTTSQRGPVVVYLILLVVHLAVWFVSLWLLLRFQWPHALGLAIVFCLIMTLWVVPLMVQRSAPVPSAPNPAALPAPHRATA
jgi:hypothetical protein